LIPIVTVSVCSEQLVIEPEIVSGSPGPTMPGLAHADRSAQGDPAIAGPEVAAPAASTEAVSIAVNRQRYPIPGGLITPS
jgi:hypothetical protein